MRERPIRKAFLRRDDGTALVVDLHRASGDVRIGFFGARSAMPRFVIVRREELEGVIDALERARGGR